MIRIFLLVTMLLASFSRLSAQSYYGVKIDGDNVAFALDISGSMEDKGEGVAASAPMTRLTEGVGHQIERRVGGRLGSIVSSRIRSETTKLGAARRELIRALDGLQPDTRFTVITFGEAVHGWPLGVQRAGGAGRRVAQAFVAQLSADGGTPLAGALQQAYAVEDVDVIFLVSDGRPTDQSATAILGMLPRLDRGRGIVVNTVGIGPDQDAELLCQIAQHTGGFYVRNGRVECHSGVCDDPETRTVYNPNPIANYHQYTEQTAICKVGQAGCTRDAVYNLMISELRFIAPSNDRSPVRQCSANILPINNPVRTFLDPSAFTASNYTKVGHVFHPGRIVRAVVQVGDEIVVRTSGEGNGDFAWLNQYVFNHTWTLEVDRRLREQFQSQRP